MVYGRRFNACRSILPVPLKLPKHFIDINFAFSRVPGEPKKYVQDRIRERSADVVRLLADVNCYMYICGLKGMEQGVDEAFSRRMPRAGRGLGPCATDAAGTGPLPRGNLLTGTKWRFPMRR
jgi:hypothetical protein